MRRPVRPGCSLADSCSDASTTAKPSKRSSTSWTPPETSGGIGIGLIDYFMSSVPCAADRRSSPPPQHKNDLNLDGSAAHGGTLPFCVTFLIFSNCMRLPIRLAAMMGLHVINVFTRDSITLGQDGSTHQPVEHLTGLRESPSLTVIRRGDADETAVAWRVAL